MHLDGTESTQETKMDTHDLTCPICMCIAGDPQITSCCQRVFCTKDADLNQYSNGCPLCREKIFTFKSSPKHKEMLEQLTIKCVCSEYIAPDDYENHLSRCLNVIFTCPHSGCREKNDSTQYNSQQLINHLARYHCDEVPLLGSTFVNKHSVESYKKASRKYDNLVSTLYTILYPKMIELKLNNSSSNEQNSSIYQCPKGHKLIDADHTKRKRRNGSGYTSVGFNCDLCHHSFPNGQSWHCSCTDSGFDKCVACFVFQLYHLDDQILKLASEDKEKQQERHRRRSFRNAVHLPGGLFNLLTQNIDDDDDDDDDDIDDDEINLDLLTLRHRSPFLHQHSTTESRNNGTTEANHRRED